MMKIFTYGPSLALIIGAIWAWVSLFEESMSSVVAWLNLLMILPILAALWLTLILLSSLIKRRWGGWRSLGLTASLLTGSTGLWNLSIGLFPFPLSEEGRASLKVRVPLVEEVIVLWGGDTIEENYHSFTPDQRWAYDLLVAPAGHQSSSLEDYGCYGAPVYAPTSGRVHLVRSGVKDQAPGEYVPDYENPTGNSVWIQPQQGGYLLVAHLRQGSIKVSEGEALKEGAPLGECGSSGNSSEPHVHIHYQEQDPKTHPNNYALGLPLAFHQQRGPARPKGGVRIEGEGFSFIGDRVQHQADHAASQGVAQGGGSPVIDRQKLTALLVKKGTLNKAGRPVGSSYYLRLSRGDVYIKLCESEPDAEALELLLKGSSSDPLLGVTVSAEVSFHEGSLDACPGDPPYVQSRVGEYALLHSISAQAAPR